MIHCTVFNLIGNDCYRFFDIMGTIFGFVSSDLKSKMDVLYAFLENDATSLHFRTAKSMIEYEKENNLLKKKEYVSGSRTLLRLHRGLGNKFLIILGGIYFHDL